MTFGSRAAQASAHQNGAMLRCTPTPRSCKGLGEADSEVLAFAQRLMREVWEASDPAAIPRFHREDVIAIIEARRSATRTS
jgi:hypothetical protein